MELALDLGQKAEKADAVCDLEKKRITALADIARIKEQEMRKAELEACENTTERLNELLTEARKTPIIRNPYFVGAVSVLGTAGVMTLTWWLAVQTIQRTVE